MSRRLPAPVLVVLLAGAALRVLAMAAAGPAWLFLNDSREYLNNAHHPSFGGYHPLGYPVFLLVTGTSGHLLALTVVQHLLGLATGGLVAATALRLGAPPWAAALGAAPQLLDPYVVVVEQTVMAETLATLLVTVAVVVLLHLTADSTRSRGLGERRSRAVGVAPLVAVALLLAAAVLVRTAALGALAGLVVWVLAQRPRPRAVAALAVALVVPLAAYVGGFAASQGQVGLTAHSQRFLYGRMAPFADCATVHLTGDAATLCDARPVGERYQPDYYLWHPLSPLKQLPENHRDAAAGQAGHAMLAAQPLTWARTTTVWVGDFLAWGPWVRHVDRTQTDPSVLVADARHSTARPVSDPRASSGNRTVRHVRRGPMAVLHGYQRYVTTPVPLYAVVALVGLVLPGRRRLVGVPAAAALGLLAVAAGTSGWDVRYLLPALPLLGLAAASVGARELR